MYAAEYMPMSILPSLTSLNIARTSAGDMYIDGSGLSAGDMYIDGSGLIMSIAAIPMFEGSKNVVLIGVEAPACPYWCPGGEAPRCGLEEDAAFGCGLVHPLPTSTKNSEGEKLASG